MRNAIIAAAAVATLTLCSGARADTWNKTYAISGHAQLRVDTNDGAVEIIPGNGKQISARVETESWKINSSEVTISEHQTGDAVEIIVREPHEHFRLFSVNMHRSIHVYLEVPSEADLDIHTGDGGITARDVAGNIRLDTGDGSMRVDGMKGRLRFHSGDGRIEGERLDGSLNADSGDGSIMIRGRFDAVDAHSGDGHIEITAENGSRMNAPWMVRTGDGRINMRLPETFNASVDAHTGDGRINFDFPLTVNGGMNGGTLRGKLGSGGESLTLRSGDGNIYIQKL